MGLVWPSFELLSLLKKLTISIHIAISMYDIRRCEQHVPSRRLVAVREVCRCPWSRPCNRNRRSAAAQRIPSHGVVSQAGANQRTNHHQCVLCSPAASAETEEWMDVSRICMGGAGVGRPGSVPPAGPAAALVPLPASSPAGPESPVLSPSRARG
jgi:hypothetical protein